MLEVVTVWAPRPGHEKWRGGLYMQLLNLQRQTVKRVGHRHVAVTDDPALGGEVLRAELPESLLHALIAGQIAYVRQWSDEHPVVLVDIDCLVVRDLDKAFDGTFDIGVTTREHPTQPIQNGVIYLAPGAKRAALKMLERTLELTEGWWGSDQEAIAKALGPVPRVHRVEERLGARIAFLATEFHNFSCKTGVPKNAPGRFVFHFKGETKRWANEAAKKHFLLPGART